MVLDVILAALPILLILLLMLRYRWGASRAGPAGWLAAMGVAVLRFGAGLDLLALTHAKALLLSVDVLLIIWAAFLLYRVADEAGAIEDIGRALPHLTADGGMQALLIGWAFASFLQGVGGFGVPVAVIAPLLLGLGFSPLQAVVIPSLGHGWAVTFGSLASSFQALMAASGIPGPELAPPAAIMLGLAGFGSGVAVVHAARGWRGVRRLIPPVLVMGAGMGAAQYALATHGLWNIAGFGGGMVGLALGVVVSRRYRGSAPAQGQGSLNGGRLAVALSAYGALIAITLLIQLVPSVRSALDRYALEVWFPALRTAQGYETPAGLGRRIAFLRHAGFILGYASFAAYWIYRRAGRYRRGAPARIVQGTLQRVLPSSLGIASMVAMAVVMAHAGMTDTLARGLAKAVGSAFPVASPWIGALGAFITGSNTNSNVVFTLLQLRTAVLLGYPQVWILAAQTAGGSVGSIIAPTKVVVGASTGGLAGQEGKVIRALAAPIGLLLAGMSALAWIFSGGLAR